MSENLEGITGENERGMPLMMAACGPQNGWDLMHLLRDLSQMAGQYLQWLQRFSICRWVGGVPDLFSFLGEYSVQMIWLFKVA